MPGLPALVWLAVAMVVASGPAAAVPFFHVAYGLNTANAPFTSSVGDAVPVFSADGETVTDPFHAKRVTVQGSAEPGRLRVVNTVETTGPFALARPEVMASFKGQVFLCEQRSPINAAPGGAPFDPGTCIAPGGLQDLPVPYPNLGITGRFSASALATVMYRVSARVNGSTVASARSNIDTSQGDQAGVLQQAVSGHVLGRLDSNSVSVDVTVHTLTGCARPGCRAQLFLGDTISFIEHEDAFLGLPPGVSVWSADLNIFDNRWFSPESLRGAASGGATVSEPSALTCLAAGIAGLGVLRRRRRPPRAGAGVRAGPRAAFVDPFRLIQPVASSAARSCDAPLPPAPPGRQRREVPCGWSRSVVGPSSCPTRTHRSEFALPPNPGDSPNPRQRPPHIAHWTARAFGAVAEAPETPCFCGKIVYYFV